ncbi:MAG: nucleotidyltransferase family protein [Dehalococcoidia bacterium]|nr:MAG: nucleotidyltransferase family protein [Dehalococcoidia bacterium]
MPDTLPAVTAILLAAGHSERMGTQKALLPWGGATLLAYHLEQLAAVDEIREIIVVTGYAAERLAPIVEVAPRARVAYNPEFESGKASSVRCGLAAIDGAPTSVLMLAVDQPRPAELLQTLVRAHAASSAPITAPVFNGRRGHPLIFDASLLPELAAIDEATLGVRAVVQRHTASVNDVAVDDPSACIDLNTRDDVERARQLLRGPGSPSPRCGEGAGG